MIESNSQGYAPPIGFFDGPAFAFFDEVSGVYPPRYLLQSKELDKTGISEIYLAWDRIEGIPVVFKATEEYKEELIKEAKLTLKLNHPNIVKAFGLAISNGIPGMIMEYLGVSNLDQLIQKRRIQPGEALSVLEGIGSAVDYLYERGLYHNDIKPRNILLTESPTLIDLGIESSLIDPIHLSDPIGTKVFMPPEVKQHGIMASDIKSQTYQLGITIIDALTQQSPNLNQDEEIDTSLCEYSEGVRNVLQKAVDPNPEKRYCKASYLTKAFKEAIS